MPDPCKTVMGGVVYGTYDDGNRTVSRIVRSRDELMPLICQTWTTRYVVEADVQLFTSFDQPAVLPKQNSHSSDLSSNSCDGLKGAVIYGIDSNGNVIVTMVANSLDEVMLLICEIWTTSRSVIVGVQFYV